MNVDNDDDDNDDDDDDDAMMMMMMTMMSTMMTAIIIRLELGARWIHWLFQHNFVVLGSSVWDGSAWVVVGRRLGEDGMNEWMDEWMGSEVEEWKVKSEVQIGKKTAYIF